MFLKLLIRHIFLLLLAIVLSGLAGATLVRFAPGFDSDASQLDTSRSAESMEAMREGHAEERQILSYYGGYLKNLARGEFGESHTFRRPCPGEPRPPTRPAAQRATRCGRVGPLRPTTCPGSCGGRNSGQLTRLGHHEVGW